MAVGLAQKASTNCRHPVSINSVEPVFVQAALAPAKVTTWQLLDRFVRDGWAPARFTPSMPAADLTLVKCSNVIGVERFNAKGVFVNKWYPLALATDKAVAGRGWA